MSPKSKREYLEAVFLRYKKASRSHLHRVRSILLDYPLDFKILLT